LCSPGAGDNSEKLDIIYEALEVLLEKGWGKFFVKDYVKSLKTATGSIISAPASIYPLVEEMRKFRGKIEGGICVRRFEHLSDERRFFILNDSICLHPKDDNLTDYVLLANWVAERVKSPFFSIDIARNEEGRCRIVEIGDGQVSDLVGWGVERFVNNWRRHYGNSDANVAGR
jgi:hypothetical protein